MANHGITSKIQMVYSDYKYRVKILQIHFIKLGSILNQILNYVLFTAQEYKPAFIYYRLCSQLI